MIAGQGMSAVQRIKGYIDSKSLEDELFKLKPEERNWLKKGEVKIDNISVRYREKLPLVLKNLSFNINENEKVALVGRTGSGKSTFLLCLMRIMELAENENDNKKGKIIIDGVDISDLGLHELRDSLTIIPQDPFLMEGSIKLNVDPSKKRNDDEIIQALKTCQLWDTLNDDMIISQKLEKKKKEKEKDKKIKFLEDEEREALKKKGVKPIDKLNFEIEGKGNNLSVGQRQLICIARALVKKPKLLLMDEATANIDQKTDSIIQNVIKKHMNETTVITIAHRLITIIQYDKIVVLKDGEKIEEGSPLQLINDNKYFCSLIDEGGEEFKKKMIYCAENKEVDPTTVKI